MVDEKKIRELIKFWREHEVDEWTECGCARCAYQSCADDLETLLSGIGYGL